MCVFEFVRRKPTQPCGLGKPFCDWFPSACALTLKRTALTTPLKATARAGNILAS